MATQSKGKPQREESTGNGKAPPPVHEIRYRNIAASIWKNQGEDGSVFYSVTVKRGYQDAEKNWHDSTSFPFGDLPTVAKALTDAHSWIGWTIRREKDEAKADNGQGKHR